MAIDLNTLICADDPLLPRVTLDFARRINNRGRSSPQGGIWAGESGKVVSTEATH
jgi:hypothetical protein